jgi:hypothetical protein
MGLTMDNAFQTQSIQYWQLYLQPGFEIPDGLVFLDSAWPILGRFLIAKLVVHSYITKLLQNFVGGALATSSSSGSGDGALKKLETGPSNAEFYNPADSLEVIMKAGTGGASPFDQLTKDICQLAQRVKIYLPICGQINQVVVPVLGKKPCPVIPTYPLVYE